MKIIMMGTGPFAIPTFNRLLESPHDVLALVTRPVPPPKGRGKAAAPPANPMRDRGIEAGLPIYEPTSVNAAEFQATLRRLGADAFVVCDYGQILSREALEAAKLGGINLHASLLPKYRGAAPINWALYHGEAETGITVIHMTSKLDGGPCLIQTAMPIDEQIDAIELERSLAVLGVDAVLESLAMLENWDGKTTLGTLQDPQLATRAPRLKKQDGLIDWQRSARQIRDQIRAFKPWPGTYTFWQHAKRGAVRLAVGAVSIDTRVADRSLAPGTVVHVDKQHLAVATGDSVLCLDELQPAGKKMLPVEQFLRGYGVQVGDVFQSKNP